MNNPLRMSIVCCCMWLTASATLAAGVSHHGGPILHCEPPHFFDEMPANDARVAAFQHFSITASDNTDGGTVKVWVNNEPVPVKIIEERSGQLRFEGSLNAPLTSGRAWIRVTGDSKDGCDELKVWNVRIGS